MVESTHPKLEAANASLKPTTVPELLSKEQVANLLGVTVRTVNNLMAKRKIPFVRLTGRIVKIPADALCDSLRRQLHHSKAQLTQ